MRRFPTVKAEGLKAGVLYYDGQFHDARMALSLALTAEQQGAAINARQQLQPLYHRNGVAYAITRDCLAAQKSIKGRRTGALVVPGHLVSIDTEWDIELVEFILARQAGGGA